MILKTLFLKNFRNYKKSSFNFCQDINFIVGPNAQGKTSLLEAIALLSLGRSFRALNLSDMIKREEKEFALETTFLSHGTCQKITLNFDGFERKLMLNSTCCPSLSSLIGLLPIVVMTPDDDLIQGPPQSRRKFIDMQIVQFDHLYLHHLSRYLKAMKQRNALLRSQQLSTIDLWENEMAQSAAYLVKKRLKFLSEINEKAEKFHEDLSCRECRLTLLYRHLPKQDDFKDYYLKLFEKNRTKEVIMGSTLAGPHRDDLEILLDERPAKYFASEGQKRTAAHTLRLASWQMLKEHIGKKPLMLIDDFGLSLDKTRREHFLQTINQLGQVFITSVDPLTEKLLSRPLATFDITSNNSR